MEETVHGYLKGKTTIIATHAIPFMKYFDEIWMMHEGKLIHKGTYEEIVKTEEFKAIKNAMNDCEKKEEKEDEETKKNGKTDIDMLFGSSSDSEKTTSTDSSPERNITLKKGKSGKSVKSPKKDKKLKLKKEKSAIKEIESNGNSPTEANKNELVANIILKDDADNRVDQKFDLKSLVRYYSMRGGLTIVILEFSLILFFQSIISYKSIDQAWYMNGSVS